jgi:hypothetical protein
MVPALDTVKIALELLAYSAVFYGSLALLVKGRQAFSDARRAAGDSRINVSWMALDFILVSPFPVIAVALLKKASAPPD